MHVPVEFHSRLSKRQENQRAFTIVELLVVIVIVGILALIVTVAYQGVRQRAATTAIHSDINGAAKQLEVDKFREGTYPSTPSESNNGQGLPNSGSTEYQYTRAVSGALFV